MVIFSALAEAAVELVPSPLGQAAAVLALKAVSAASASLRPPNMRDVVLVALQEHMVFTKHQLDRLEARMNRLQTQRLPIEESFEIIVEWYGNTLRTANYRKRQMLLNVLLHGLSQPEVDFARKRFIARAVAEMTVDEIDLLRRLADTPTDGSTRFELNDVELASYKRLDTLLDEPQPEPGRMFIRTVTPGHGTGVGVPSDLGRDLLASVQDPNFDDDETVGVISKG